MSSKSNVMKQITWWLLPSTIELCAYAVIAVGTLLVSNVSAVQKFFMVAQDIDLRLAVLGSIEAVLAGLLGPSAAAALITGAFWALVGMLVYVLLWLAINFSTELTNDLAISRYLHPKGSNTLSPLMHLFLRILFQLLVATLLFFYVNFLLQGLVPMLTASYAGTFDDWPAAANIVGSVAAIFGQVAGMHVATVLIRLVVLRKRVFGGKYA